MNEIGWIYDVIIDHLQGFFTTPLWRNRFTTILLVLVFLVHKCHKVGTIFRRVENQISIRPYFFIPRPACWGQGVMASPRMPDRMSAFPLQEQISETHDVFFHIAHTNPLDVPYGGLWPLTYFQTYISVPKFQLDQIKKWRTIGHHLLKYAQTPFPAQSRDLMFCPPSSTSAQY